MKMMGSARRRRFTHEPVADSLEVFIREWSEGGHRRRQVVSSFERISIVLRWASRSRATSERLNRDLVRNGGERVHAVVLDARDPVSRTSPSALDSLGQLRSNQCRE